MTAGAAVECSLMSSLVMGSLVGFGGSVSPGFGGERGEPHSHEVR
jgi:hypothetical protein